MLKNEELRDRISNFMERKHVQQIEIDDIAE
jgi:hypothetical protein